MQNLSIGGLYRHFKGDMYRILELATHTETDELLVIYMNMNTRKVYARPFDMFVSRVDKEKYPHVTQEFRFEKINMPD